MITELKNENKQLKQFLESKGIDMLFAYSRKSRDIDEEGLKKHHFIIQDFADKLGLPVQFYEEVESSETLNRPKLNLLRKDIQAKKVKCLIVYRIDRLSRKVTDTERLIKEFAFNDLILIEAHREKIVNYNEILGIKLEAMMSDLYQEQAKIVLSAGRKKAVQMYGNHLGVSCLGYSYNKETKKLEPNQDAWIVKDIFKLYLEGYSTHSIAVKLNNMGLTTQKGGLFKGKAVWQILQNEKYKGVQIYGKKEWYKDSEGKVHCKNRDESEWVVYSEAHEPIISEEMFNKVQIISLANNSNPKNDRYNTHTLTRLVRCGRCGSSMSMIQRKNTVNVRSCSKRNYETGESCRNSGVKGDKIEDYIVKILFTVIRPVVLQLKKDTAKSGKTIKKTIGGQELEDLFKQEKKLKQHLNKLIEMQLEFTTDLIATKMKQVESQLLYIQGQIVEASGEATVDEFTWVDTFLSDAEDLVGFPFNYRGMAAEQKNIFLKQYIENVTVLDGQILGVIFAKEVEKFLNLVTNVTEITEQLGYDWVNQIENIEKGKQSMNNKIEQSMFCYQCQETAGCTGCTKVGVCGKTPETARMQDLLVYTSKGLSEITTRLRSEGKEVSADVDNLVTLNLFTTITNANFDIDVFYDRVRMTLKVKNDLINKLSNKEKLSEAALWTADSVQEFEEKAKSVGVLATENEDVRSLRELITYGLKGMSAYMKHANVLGFDDKEVNAFMQSTLAKLLDDSLEVGDLVALTLETGKFGVSGMALLDKANTTTYGNPEITKVNIGVGKNPGILISGHDLGDLEQLLKQTEGTGVDVYTHSEMLPAHYYPHLKKYKHLVGNYGNAWWKQKEEFESFNGPILMTTNCIVPPRDSYKDKLFTTGSAGYPGCRHIAGTVGAEKDFSEIIELAKKCQAPTEIETGEIIGGFAHEQVFALADKVVDAVKSGAIKKFFVMAGCDGRAKSRNYYTEFAQALPKDTVILTAGCAKYKYNKLELGDIGGIPRVLDAGQCNDSYSLALIALKLKEVFELQDINELPLAFNIAWYEQKAVIVLLSLLYLGVKNIHLGPTLPAFLSPNVANVLVENFGIAGIGTVEDDLKIFLG